ncbi:MULTISPECIES: ATP-binding protein [unclassified Streptomyces]|uniref:ATP-binding protein n=1 Tax=unclassified Streptomyces TaxID=2593676 RepID=UPI0003670246|nr:ATP-binding protein [Streptomyces sp. BoleA5]MYX39142.1 ATP-binding protein [Streptomyces sp. SID8377]
MTARAKLQRRHVLTLPTAPLSVALARRTGEYVYTSWGVAPGDAVLDRALLILSELVANSVRHAAGVSPSLDVVYATGGGVLAFAVYDRHPHRPDLLRAAAAGGGLAMVAEVTAECGGTAAVHPDPGTGGKAIWVTLPLYPA